uniref:GPN-loop GTPase n=1 Tax=Gongylonema pulchrum TaxID=637853 RepID=A0A183DY49_9BILA
LRETNTTPYVVNLDPAVSRLPYAVDIDIRDTVKYKEVVDFIKLRSEQRPFCLVDTPGQIEAFTWSASGYIITDALASTFPTMIAFVVDSAFSLVFSAILKLLHHFGRLTIFSELLCFEYIKDIYIFWQTFQVVDFIKLRSEQRPFCLVDTPGQIEAFTWSASGYIITDALASTFPTMIAFVVDSVRAANPTTFMSNMLYACSILFRTKLPFIVVFNKADIVKPSFATKWMDDFESFQEALDQNSSSFVTDLTRSLSLVLDQFYKDLITVSVSSLTGEGIDDFLKRAKDCIQQYFDVYRPMYDKVLKDKAEALAKEAAEGLEKLSTTEVKVCEVGGADLETAPKIEKIHLGGVEEENLEDSMLPR